MTILDLNEATTILNSYISEKETNYSLDRMVKLMDFLGNPQNNIRIVHVAGTSGKTSTAYYTAALLMEAGYKVGLTVSPHITSVNERVQINLQALEEGEFCQLLAKFLPFVELSAVRPTYFELLIAFAFWSFDKLGVDYAVVEVGLGGLLDATNVIDRNDKICLITDIGLDHTEILGHTIGEITAQKAGIIHVENEVFMNRQNREVEDVVRQKCIDVNARLHILDKENAVPTLPLFQNRNLSLATAAYACVARRANKPQLTSRQIRSVSQTLIPARMEVFTIDDKIVVLDGAHNVQKIDALTRSLRAYFPDQAITIVASFGRNKLSGVKEGLCQLRAISDTIICTMFDGGQDEIRVPMGDSEVAKIAQEVGFRRVTISHDPVKAIDDFLLSPRGILLVTGSLYLASQVRPLLVGRTQRRDV